MLGLLLAVLVVAGCAWIGSLNGHPWIGTAVGVVLVAVVLWGLSDPRNI